MTQQIVEYQPQLPEDTGFYRVIRERPWIAMMPDKIVSPMSLEEQIAAVDSPPTSIESRPVGGGRSAPYLGIDYVEPELYRIFGSRNMLVLTLPGYPQYRQETIEINHKPTVVTVVSQHVLLVLRWQDGGVSHYEGWGEMEHASSSISLANVIRGATSYAVTDAAKRIGPHFGLALKALIEGGLMEDIEANNARDTIMKLADGTRVWWDATIEAELHVTENVLDDIAMLVVKRPIGEVEGKEAVTLARYIESLPTLEQLQNELDALQAVDSSIPDDISYHDLMQRKRKMQEARRQQGAKPAARR